MWRLRWRKAMGRELQVPYAEGRLSTWLEHQRHAPFWQMPWPARLAWLACGVFLVLAPSVTFTPNAQALFAILQIVLAFALRRYAGPICALALVMLSVIASTRYFYWRLTMTLPFSGGEWVWGLSLWVTEVLVGLAWAMRMLEHHAPLLHAPPPLPQAAVSWPSVDMLLWCDDPDAEAQQAQLQAQIQSVRAWDWPRNKLHIHVAGPHLSTALQTRLLQEQVHSHSAPKLDALLDRPEWLAALGAELLLVVEGQGEVSEEALQVGAASLGQALGLAYVCTPSSISAPSVWAAAPLRDAEHLAPLMLARRSALQAMATGTQSWHVAGLVPAGTRVAEEAQVSSRWLLCSAAPNAWSLMWRLRARALLQGLDFYAPLAWVMVWTTPLLCLGWGWTPVHSSWAGLLAYAVPHVLLASLAWRAQDRGGRLSVLRLLREWLLQVALLWRTARAFVFTQLRYWGRPLWPRWTPRFSDPVLPWTVWCREGLVLGLHAAVLFPLLTHVPTMAAWRGNLMGLYLAWALYNVLSALARLAVAKEAALVEEETQRRAEQFALVTLGTGRVLRTTTINFPQTSLALRWERTPEAALDIGRAVTVSVMHRGVAHNFAAEVQAWRETGVTLLIAASAESDYAAFGAAVFSRETDWPRWLAGRLADQLFPDWAHRLYKTVESVFYDFVIARTGLQSLTHRLRAWIRPGSPDHG